MNWKSPSWNPKFISWWQFHIYLRLSLKVARVKSRRTIFQRYHNSITDSAANGSNNIFILIIIVVFSTTFTVLSFLNSIGVSGINLSFSTFPPIYFPLTTAYTVFGSTCFLWNLEFKNFLLRRIVTIYRGSRSFNPISRNKTHPLQEEPRMNHLHKSESIVIVMS